VGDGDAYILLRGGAVLCHFIQFAQGDEQVVSIRLVFVLEMPKSSTTSKNATELLVLCRNRQGVLGA
jgi:hypothetical protein